MQLFARKTLDTFVIDLTNDSDDSDVKPVVAAERIKDVIPLIFVEENTKTPLSFYCCLSCKPETMEAITAHGGSVVSKVDNCDYIIVRRAYSADHLKQTTDMRKRGQPVVFDAWIHTCVSAGRFLEDHHDWEFLDSDIAKATRRVKPSITQAPNEPNPTPTVQRAHPIPASQPRPAWAILENNRRSLKKDRRESIKSKKAQYHQAKTPARQGSLWTAGEKECLAKYLANSPPVAQVGLPKSAKEYLKKNPLVGRSLGAVIAAIRQHELDRQRKSELAENGGSTNQSAPSSSATVIGTSLSNLTPAPGLPPGKEQYTTMVATYLLEVHRGGALHSLPETIWEDFAQKNTQLNAIGWSKFFDNNQWPIRVLMSTLSGDRSGKPRRQATLKDLQSKVDSWNSEEDEEEEEEEDDDDDSESELTELSDYVWYNELPLF